MPLFNLREPWQHRGKEYEAGLVEASDAVYMAARAAGVVEASTAAGEAPPAISRDRTTEADQGQGAAGDTAEEPAEADAVTEPARRRKEARP